MVQRIKTVKEYLEHSTNILDWENSGILYGLDQADAAVLAEKLEEMRKTLLEYPSVVIKEIEITIFCIIRRAFSGYNYLINSCRKTLDFVIKNKHILLELCAHSYNSIDGESEFTALMAQEIVGLRL